MTHDPTRRRDVQRMTPEERMLREATIEIENLGADPRLTDAVCSLAKAAESLADFIDGVESAPQCCSRSHQGEARRWRPPRHPQRSNPMLAVPHAQDQRRESEEDARMKPIPGYPGYYATEEGGIYSTRTGETVQLTTRLHKGYPHVNMRRGSGRKTSAKESVSRAVLMAHEGLPPTPSHVCRMIDGDPINTRLSNLVWSTWSGVVVGMIERGTSACLRRGERSNCAKLSDAACAIIRKRVGCGETQTAVAADYGVSQEHVGAIARGVERVPTPRGVSISGA